MTDEKRNPDEKISAKEAGEILGVSGKTVLRLMEKGDLPGYKVGDVWKFKRGEVEAYFDAQRYRPGNPGRSEPPNALDPAA